MRIIQRTLANLSHWSQDQIQSLRLLLRGDALVPAAQQGSTTNRVVVRATDRGIPPASSETSFWGTVPECIEANLGETVVEAGGATSVSVRLLSTTALTNMVFNLVYPPERFADTFEMTVNSPQVLTQALEVTAPGVLCASFTLEGGSVLQGPIQVGSLSFVTLPEQSSAFVTLPLVDVSGRKPDGTLAANAFGLAGRVVVIGSEPLLEARASGATGVEITLYGLPGVSCAVLAADQLPASDWTEAWSATLEDFSEGWPVEPSREQLFYQAIREWRRT